MQPNIKFKERDRVKLKSGGPEMLVDSYRPHATSDPGTDVKRWEVVCNWVENGLPKSGGFKEDDLELIPE